MQRFVFQQSASVAIRVSIAAFHSSPYYKTNMTSEEKDNPRWAADWAAGINPGELFDAQMPLPALTKMVNEGSIPKGRALVPGCGRGYDVLLLAAPDRVTVGLDLSDIAIAAAEELYSSLPEGEGKGKPQRDSVVFQAGSFFDLPEDTNNKFDFVYDYTFFCALHMSVRADWAQKMAAIIAPGGELCTIMYPIGEREGGPPYSVCEEDYRTLLEPLGFESFLIERLLPEMCHKGRAGVSLISDEERKKMSLTTKDGGVPYTSIGRWRKK